MRKMKKLTSLVLVLLFTGSVGFAQGQGQGQGQQAGDISDKELKEFANLQQTIQKINQDGQKKMVKAIQDNDMTVQDYQEISKSMQQGQEPEMTPEEKKSYEAADKVVSEQQKEMQKKMDKKFEESDMERERYIEINRSVSQDPELQERLRGMQEGAN
ncbi:MAG: DUF4168 domain-containing protein [Bacteroidota bacterium]